MASLSYFVSVVCVLDNTGHGSCVDLYIKLIFDPGVGTRTGKPHRDKMGLFSNGPSQHLMTTLDLHAEKHVLAGTSAWFMLVLAHEARVENTCEAFPDEVIIHFQPSDRSPQVCS